MKKLTLNLLAILMALVCIPAMTSCGSDGDDGPTGEDLEESLQGSWKLTHAKVKAMGQTVEFDEDDIEDLKGEMGVAGFYDQYLNFNGSYVNGNLYNIDGNKFNVPAWYGDDIWFTLKVTESTLKMSTTITTEGVKVSEELTYTRTSKGRSAEDAAVSDSGLVKAIASSVLR